MATPGSFTQVQDSYRHMVCGTRTRPGRRMAESLSRDPAKFKFLLCEHCETQLPLAEFEWAGGQPLAVSDPS